MASQVANALAVAFERLLDPALHFKRIALQLAHKGQRRMVDWPVHIGQGLFGGVAIAL